MSRPSLPAALWLGFALMVAHNAEEWLTMGPYVEARRASLPAFLRGMTGHTFAMSLVLVSLLELVVVWAGARSRPHGLGLLVAVGLQPALVLNAAQHAALATWSRAYAPGVATGVVLVLPFASYIVVRAVRERVVRPGLLAVVAAAEIAAMVPVLLGAHALAMLLT